jgi:alpha-tubulin suppressor-like RCC1 family protein/subtilisin family serine protease
MAASVSVPRVQPRFILVWLVVSLVIVLPVIPASPVATAAPILAPADARTKLDATLQAVLDGRTRLAPTVRGATDGGRVGVTIIASRDLSADLANVGATTGARSPNNVHTATIPTARLMDLAALPGVDVVSAFPPVTPRLDKSLPGVGVVGADGTRSLISVDGTQVPADGRGTIVAVVDTGIDFTHEDFRNTDGSTRILAIWDQDTAGSGTPAIDNAGTTYDAPAFSFGTLCTHADITAALAGTTARCTERDTNGHGTHVASTAGGNLGVAPKADLLIVNSIGASQGDPAAAWQWIVAWAKREGKPVSITNSWGTHSGPHDGTDAYSRALDGWATLPGVAFVVAAGNEGSDPIHASGVLDATASAPFKATGNATELHVYYDKAHAYSARVRHGSHQTTLVPKGATYSPSSDSGYASLGGTIASFSNCTTTYQSVCAIEVTLTGLVTNDGTWSIELVRESNIPSADQTWHAYVANEQGAAFTSPDYRGTLDEPAVARGAITVGAWTTKPCWSPASGGSSCNGGAILNSYARFSSLGPTRDGRLKPEVSAPGEVINAALSRYALGEEAARVTAGSLGQPNGRLAIQGTSMATPHIGGVLALLFQANATLTTVQLKDALIGSNTSPRTVTDAFTEVTTGAANIIDVPSSNDARVGANAPSNSGRPAWNNRWGYGKANAMRALQAVASVAPTVTPTLRPTFTPTPSGVFAFKTGLGAIAVGDAHACVVRGDGTVACWGSNADGQVGDGTTTNRTSPVTISGAARFARVYTGGSHTCAIDADGAAWCWGKNNSGQLGDGTSTNRPSPVKVNGNATFTMLSAGAYFTCGLTSSGTILCWGDNSYGQRATTIANAIATPAASASLPDGASGWAAITAGAAHTCAITVEGDAYCWGNNGKGQLGDGTTTNTGTTGAISAVNAQARFTAISAGASHTCALDTVGDLYCWGWNGNLQLGDGTQTDRPMPIIAATPESFSAPWTSLEVGYAHTCASDAAETTWCWGLNTQGQLGTGSSAQLVAAPNAVSGTYARLGAGGSAATGSSTCGVATWDVRCWGANGAGQLGNGSTYASNVPVPVAFATPTPSANVTSTPTSAAILTVTPTPSRTLTAITTTRTATPTVTGTAVRTSTATVARTSTTTPTTTRTVTATVTRTPSPSPTITRTPTVTPTSTISPTPTITRTATMTRTVTVTRTSTVTITKTRTVTPTPTITRTATGTLTPTTTGTATVTRTATTTRTPTTTRTSTITRTVTRTRTATPTRSLTPVPTRTSTSTPTRTWTAVPSRTRTPTP